MLVIDSFTHYPESESTSVTVRETQGVSAGYQQNIIIFNSDLPEGWSLEAVRAAAEKRLRSIHGEKLKLTVAPAQRRLAQPPAAKKAAAKKRRA